MESYTTGFVKFFKKHPQIFNVVVQRMDRGKYESNLRHETLNAVKTALSPAVALAIKVYFPLLF